MISTSQVQSIFSHLENGNAEAFFEYVSDDVIWEVTGHHPLAGIYTSKDEFRQSTMMRLNHVLKSGLNLKVVGCVNDGKTVAVELIADSVAKNGTPFNNRYCWVCQFSDGRITHVRAYLDSALVAKVLEENE